VGIGKKGAMPEPELSVTQSGYEMNVRKKETHTSITKSAVFLHSREIDCYAWATGKQWTGTLEVL